MSWPEGEDAKEEHTLSVAEAIQEAMNTPQGPDVSKNNIPEPHLPLRKATAQRLKSRHSPKPLFAPSSHSQLRGFNPSPVEPLPHIDVVTASSEHAFAGRNVRRPSKLPLGSLVLRHGQQQGESSSGEVSSSLPDQNSAGPPPSPLLPPLPLTPQDRQKGSRSQKLLGEGLRGLRHRLSSNKSIHKDGRATPDSMAHSPSIGTDDVRQSFRSALTSGSSYLNSSSIITDGSSFADGNSSNSEYVKVYPNWPDIEEGRGSMSVEDAIGMYADGFESAKQSMDTHEKQSFQVERPSTKHSTERFGKRSLQVERPSSQPWRTEKPKRPNQLHRRSQSASLLDRWKPSVKATLAPPLPPLPPADQRTSPHIVDGSASREHGRQEPTSHPSVPDAVPRDRYGFKKASHHITVEQYDAWDVQYSEHLERRSKKWHALMRSYGLNSDKPFRFPPKGDKIKRYVRKGIPPELRGAAWYWYAGGPARLAKDPGLYWDLIEQVENGRLSDNDREHIERDLNRTFPDNIRFKPDPTTTSDVQAGAGVGKKRRSFVEPETLMVKALRRVLQAFAVHNPNIGYCQSLNFIAGLLLLFLDDEEKSFILLEIITSVHLPGTHGVALEGANIDIAVLMSCIKDCLPAIWEKLDDKGGLLDGESSAQNLRLPTVSLATTAWFMSLFVGTLPIEAVLRVWDCLFLEGSRTLFRVALAIFKAGESQIMAVSDPMEIFQVVQTIPRSMLDVNALIDVCFRRGRGGFGHVSQELIERRREERRRQVREGVVSVDAGALSRLKGRWRSKTKI